jgi:NitT/TauT family transport system substrate-binding protein
VTEFAPRAWIDKNGGDSSGMKFIELTFSEMPTALAQGRIDAALMAEPSLTEYKSQVRVLGKCYDGIARNFVIAAYFTTTSWAQAHPELVRNFQDALRRTAAWANKNHAKSEAILAANTKIDPDVLRTMTRSDYPERLNAAELQPLIDATAKYGGIPSSFPASELIYTSPRR